MAEIHSHVSSILLTGKAKPCWSVYQSIRLYAILGFVTNPWLEILEEFSKREESGVKPEANRYRSKYNMHVHSADSYHSLEQGIMHLVVYNLCNITTLIFRFNWKLSGMCILFCLNKLELSVRKLHEKYVAIIYMWYWPRIVMIQSLSAISQ